MGKSKLSSAANPFTVRVNMKNSNYRSKNRTKQLVGSSMRCNRRDCDASPGICCNEDHLPSTADEKYLIEEIFPGHKASNELKEEDWERGSASDARKEAIFNLSHSLYSTLSRMEKDY